MCTAKRGRVLGQELPGNKTSKSTGCECKRSSRRRNSLCTTTCCCSWQHRGLMERKMRLCSGCCLCRCRGKLPGVVAAALPRVQHVSFWPSVWFMKSNFNDIFPDYLVGHNSWVCVGVCAKLPSHACVSYKWTHLSLATCQRFVACCTLHWDKFRPVLVQFWCCWFRKH